MMKVRTILIVLALLALLALGVDLAYQRAGIGLVAIGALLAVMPWMRRRNDWSVSVLEVLAVWFAGGYFLWRGWTSDTPTFAVADGVLFVTFTGAYLATRMLGAGGLRTLVYAIIALGVLNTAFAYYQHQNAGMAYVFREGVIMEGVMTGLFGHYNYFAGFMNVVVILLLALIVSPSTARKERVVLAVLGVAFLGTIYLSGSRGGWLAFLAGVGGFGVLYALRLYQEKNPAFKLILGLISVVLVFGGITLSQKFDHALDQRGHNKSTAMVDGGRLVFQQWAFDFFLKEPVVGNGPRSFEHLALSEWDTDDLVYHFPDPDFVHNEFLQMLCDYGLIGFALLVIALFVTGVRGLIGLLSKEESPGLTSQDLILGGAAALIALLVQSLFSFLAHGPTFIGMIAILMALMFGGCRVGKKVPMLSKGLASISGLAVAIVGMVLVTSLYFQQKGNQDLRGAVSLEQELAALGHIRSAAVIGSDSLLAEEAGLVAHRLSVEAASNDAPLVAQTMRKEAIEAFDLALTLNPHALVALCAKARIHDESGEYEKGYQLHLEATEKAWAREYFLRPNFQAAKNRAILGLQEMNEGRQQKAEEYFAESLAFLNRRNDLMQGNDRFKDSQGMRLRLAGFLAYYHGLRLYKEGDSRWKKRDAEGGLALMLEARKRYEQSQKIVQRQVPLWGAQWTQLNENIKILEGANIKPSVIAPEEIERIARQGP